MVISPSTYAFELRYAPDDEPHRRGVTYSRSLTSESGVRQSLLLTVSIEPGLPEIEFECVAAHELTHVWLRLANLTLPIEIEEGLAEVNSHWYLRQDSREMARAVRQQIAVRDNDIYGDGFRQVYQDELTHGWKAVLERIYYAR